MKKIIVFLIVFTLLVAAGCGTTETSSDTGSKNVSAESSKTNSEESSEASEESEMSIDEKAKVPVPEGADVITNLDYDNKGGRLGDNDGPAYVVYSKTGYNKGSFDLEMSKMKINNVRESDGKNLNAYIFLGADVYSGSSWVNCFDTGFCYSGKNGGWHLFYSVYEKPDPNEYRWYESKIILDMTRDYRLVLDTSVADETAAVYVYDITDGEKLVDSKEFKVKGLKADGSNTSYLMDFALDYPADTKLDTDGNPSEKDWEEITLYNTDENVYMQNVLISNAKLYKAGNVLDWTDEHTSNRAMWPDINMSKIDYPVTKVIDYKFDTKFRIDLDMNRE